MAKKRSFYDMDYKDHLGGTIFMALTFIALVLCTTGTPLSALNPKDDSKMCYTLWGVRPDCNVAEYSWRIDSETCPHRLFRWQSAEAFSIVAIFFLFFQFFGAYFVTAGHNIKLEMLCCAIFTAASTVVPWAVTLSFYYTPYCGDHMLTERNTKLGAGFALLVTSFCVQMVGLLALLFLEPEHVAKKPMEESEKVRL